MGTPTFPVVFGRLTHLSGGFGSLPSLDLLFRRSFSSDCSRSRNPFFGFFPSIHMDLDPLQLELTPPESPLAHLPRLTFDFNQWWGPKCCFSSHVPFCPETLFLNFSARSTRIQDFCHEAAHHQSCPWAWFPSHLVGLSFVCFSSGCLGHLSSYFFGFFLKICKEPAFQPSGFEPPLSTIFLSFIRVDFAPVFAWDLLLQFFSLPDPHLDK